MSAVGTLQQTPVRWVIDPSRGLVVSRPAAVMGILNATPDSFSDGGLLTNAHAAGLAMGAAGAAWIDVGGESTRPGAQPVTADEELRRVLPVVAALRGTGPHVSIDTSKAVVAAAALATGAVLVNDVSAGADPEMFATVAAARCPMVLMHRQGIPATMQQAPRYHDVVDDVLAFLVSRIEAAQRAGIAEAALLIDPGIGFGKALAHNTALLRALPRLVAATGRPLVLGVSRKSFLPPLTGRELPAAERDAWSHIIHALHAPHCALLRVHDVRGTREALALAAAVAPEGTP